MTAVHFHANDTVVDRIMTKPYNGVVRHAVANETTSPEAFYCLMLLYFELFR